MPNKPKKLKRQWMPERKPFGRRAVDNSKFYNSSTWRNIAKRHKAAHPLCVKCLGEGRHVAVEFTDHIIRIEDGGGLTDLNNLQSLCASCHNSKSGREAHGKRGIK